MRVNKQEMRMNKQETKNSCYYLQESILCKLFSTSDQLKLLIKQFSKERVVNRQGKQQKQYAPGIYYILKQRQLMINECKSMKLFQHIQKYSQNQMDALTHLRASHDRLECQPSEYLQSSRTSLDHEIQQFKKDIEQRFQLSIANKLYTFPKRIKTVFDILSSEQESSSQSRNEKDAQNQRDQSRNRQPQIMVKHKSKKKINLKDAAHKNTSNSNSPLKSMNIRNSTKKKHQKHHTQKSASKSKGQAKPSELKPRKQTSTKTTQKQAKTRQKPTEPVNHRFLQAMKSKARKA